MKGCSRPGVLPVMGGVGLFSWEWRWSGQPRHLRDPLCGRILKAQTGRGWALPRMPGRRVLAVLSLGCVGSVWHLQRNSVRGRRVRSE